MDAEKAGKIGRAFALGYVYGHGVLMAQDINLKTGKLEGSDAREFSKYFGKDIDKIISDNFTPGDAS